MTAGGDFLCAMELARGVTHKLSRKGGNVRVVGGADTTDGGGTVIEIECPWCAAAVALESPALPAQVRCGECSTAVDVADGAADEQRLAA